MKRYSSWSIVPGLVLCVAGIAAGQQQEHKPAIPNYASVNAKIFRGGQPTKEGMKKLAADGVKTVINLRNADTKAQTEELEAREAGLRYFNIPLDNFGRPSDSKVDQILSLITDVDNQPVFVHCKRGSDRTGLVIAIYRMSFEGWTDEQATSEAKRYGLGFWQIGMKDYIEDYYKRRKKK